MFEDVREKRVYRLICESDAPLGELHDVLMQWKGYTVDRMIAAHSEEQAANRKMLEQEALENEE